MNDDQILSRGGDERDISEYSKQNGAEEVDADIFERAIIKARDNGYRGIYDNRPVYNIIVNIPRRAGMTYMRDLLAVGIIFSNSFCRAFFGEKSKKLKAIKIKEHTSVTRIGIRTRKAHTRMVMVTNNKGWQYHRSQMALLEQPLTYLEKFL